MQQKSICLLAEKLCIRKPHLSFILCGCNTWLYLRAQCICTAEILVSSYVYTCVSILLTYVLMSHWFNTHYTGNQAGLPGNAVPSQPRLRLAAASSLSPSHSTNCCVSSHNKAKEERPAT